MSKERTVDNVRFDIIGKRKMAMGVSIALILLSIALLATRGLNLGLDFTGGFLVEVSYKETADLNNIRQRLEGGGFDKAQVQNFGSSREVLVRVPPREGASGAQISSQVLALLNKNTEANPPEMRRVEYVGPQVGEELRDQGGLAVIYALIGIVIYVWLRFEKKFSVGSVAALVHDVIITLGVFALTQAEFDLSVLAAILAVIGYSLNDTIVVFDRIRENFRKLRKGTPTEIINLSVNQTLSRTIVTSLTTLLVLSALYIFGGEVISGFSLALIVGVLVGTYSSIYVASTSVLALGITKQDLMPPKKEGEDLPEMP